MSDLWTALAYVVLALPQLAVDMCWCARIVSARRGRAYQSWVYAVVSCVVLTHPGGLVARGLCGEPSPTWACPHTIPATVLAWAVIMFTPGLSSLLERRPLRALLSLGSSVSGLRSVVGMVDFCLPLFPHAAHSCIVLGAVCGSVGGLMDVYERRRVGGRADAHANANGFQAALMAAALYYSQTEAAAVALPWLPAPVVSRDTAVVLLWVLFYAPNGLVCEFHGPVPVFYPLELAFKTLLVEKYHAPLLDLLDDGKLNRSVTAETLKAEREAAAGGTVRQRRRSSSRRRRSSVKGGARARSKSPRTRRQ